jgi:hypothetical protein
MIDHVADIRDVVGPAGLNGNIPAGVYGVQRRDDESLAAGAHHLEAAVSGLTLGRSAAAVEIQHQRQALMSVISGWDEQSIGARPLPGHQLLRRHTGHVRKITGTGRRRPVLRIRVRRAEQQERRNDEQQAHLPLLGQRVADGEKVAQTIGVLRLRRCSPNRHRLPRQ